MKIRLAVLGVLATLVCVVAVTFVAPAFGAKLPVTICHRTGSAEHPYITITPSNEGVYNNHVGDPEGTGHTTQDGLHDFVLGPDATEEDCAKADPGK